MPYSITRAAGTVLAVVEDGNVNTTYSVSFVGKTYSNYGQTINNNFLRLLENSARNVQPTTSITGQLWYDTGVAKLKYFDGTNYNSLITGVVGDKIALGTNAGQTSQGLNAVAIGALAGQASQASNTIILNATGSALNGVAGQASRFYVKPVRDGGAASGMSAAGFKPCYYNPTTGEFVYASS